MSYCKAKGYQIGDHFIVAKNSVFAKKGIVTGDVVTLHFDDATRIPAFSHCKFGEFYFNVDDVVPIKGFLPEDESSIEACLGLFKICHPNVPVDNLEDFFRKKLLTMDNWKITGEEHNDFNK